MAMRCCLAIFVLATVVAGCGGGADPETVVAAPPAGNASGTSGQLAAPVEVLPPSAAGSIVDLKTLVDAALADAARRTGLEASALQVIGAELVTWSDGSLGCPAPGRSYTMALVPGYRIRIQAGAEVLNYHASMRGYMLLCPAGLVVEPLPLQTK